MMLRTRSVALAAIVLLGTASAARAAKTIQIDVSSVLNGRAISTVSNGKVTTWGAGQGVDGGDGYITKATQDFVKGASLVAGGGNPGPAIPIADDPKIPAAADHPELLLHYSNDDATSPQSRRVTGAGTFMFPVPEGKYSKIFLIMHSSEGDSPVSVDFVYADAPVTKMMTVRDYFFDPVSKYPDSGYVAKGLGKWDQQNRAVEAKGHNIFWFGFPTDATKVLKSIKITKMAGGSGLVFWGATGVAESDVVLPPDGGGGGTPDASAAKDAGAGATGGAGGSAGGGGAPGGNTGGGTGSGGAAGSRGSSGGAGGASTTAGAGGMSGTGAGGDDGTTSPPRRAAKSGGCAIGGGARPGVGLLGIAMLVAGLRRRARRRA